MDKHIANLSATLSFMTGSLTWFSTNGDSITKIITALVSIVTGFFASRYYYYAIKEKRQNLKNNK